MTTPQPGFDPIARAYALLVDEPKRWAYEGPIVARWLEAAGERRRRVLDVGCGTGFHARHLAGHLGAQVTAIDPAAGMLDAASGRPFGDRVGWLAAPAEAPPDGPFDLILVLGNTLSLIADPADSLAALARVAVPNALLVIQTLDYDALRQGGPKRVVRSDDRLTIEKRLTPVPDESPIAARLEITVRGSGGERLGGMTEELHDHPTARLESQAARQGWTVIDRRRSYRYRDSGNDRILLLRLHDMA